MSEQSTIPPKLLETATVQYMTGQGYSEKAIERSRQDRGEIWQNAERRTRLILEAAGVPALLARMADSTGAEVQLATLRPKLADCEDALAKAYARVAEFERELAELKAR